MANLMRFGRRMSLPSTRQIRHELIVLGNGDEARRLDADKKKREIEATLPAPAGETPV